MIKANNARTMSPSSMGILLHYYYMTTPYEPWTDSVKLSVEDHISSGLMTVPHTLTGKGMVYIEYLLRVPLPIETYIIPEQEKE